MNFIKFNRYNTCEVNTDDFLCPIGKVFSVVNRPMYVMLLDSLEIIRENMDSSWPNEFQYFMMRLHNIMSQ